MNNASTKNLLVDDVKRNRCTGFLTTHWLFTPFSTSPKSKATWGYFNQNLSYLWDIHERVPLATFFVRSYCTHLEYSTMTSAYVWQDDDDTPTTTLVGLVPRQLKDVEEFHLWAEEARSYAYNSVLELIKQKSSLILEPLNNAVTRKKRAIHNKKSTLISLGSRINSITV